MSKKNLYIKKYLSGKLPEPEVRADDAWANMNDMLGGNPVSDTQFSSVNKLKFLLKGGLSSIAAIGVATSIWLLVPEEKGKNIENSIKIFSLDSSNAVQSLAGSIRQKLDSARIDQKIDSARQSLILKEQEQRESDLDNSERLTIPNNITSISQESARSKMDSSDFKPIQNQRNSGIYASKSGFTKSYSSARTKVDSKVNQGYLKAPSEFSGKTEKVENRNLKKQQNRQTFSNSPGNLNLYQILNSENNAGEKSGKINAILENRLLISASKLISKSLVFNNLAIKQIRPIPYNRPISTPNQKSNKDKKSLFETLHVGLEWNAASSFNSTKYILKGTDSTSKSYLLLVPGIWISKDITEKQLLRLSFYANQPFYGGLKRVQRMGADSVPYPYHNNIDLIKATGINLAFQYEYRFIQNLIASAGFSYSPLRKALAQNNYENYQGIIMPVSKLVLNKQNINQYMNTSLFTFKTGLTFSPGRYQFGVNVLIPISNLSLTPTSSLKTLNGQFFFRFTVR